MYLWTCKNILGTVKISGLEFDKSQVNCDKEVKNEEILKLLATDINKKKKKRRKKKKKPTEEKKTEA